MAKLGLPPGFRFVPTDEEVVAHYLLRRIRCQPLPAGDILEDDPLSAPPWLLLAKHGRKGDAFFFAAGRAMNSKGTRQKRSCAGGGTWEGQGKRKNARGGGEAERRPRVRVGGEVIEWQKYALNFHEEDIKGSTGWVMHEYSIASPPDLAESPMRVYRIRFSGHGRNAQKRKRSEPDWGSDEEEEEEVYAGAARGATRPMVEEFVGGGGCPPAPQLEPVASLPVVGVDVGDGNLAGWAEAGAGGALPAADQDLPALVDGGEDWNFMCSLNDLLPDFDFFPGCAGDAGDVSIPMVPAA
ncbi:unnamed protein product [Urochloa decumbens]|uniref:NAC domain-containing protein n=1 Tax=Urochloa decumbens TaxID=240449 RepID=A0ABC8ZHN0_9POAL